MTENINFDLRKYSRYNNYIGYYTLHDYAVDIIDIIKNSISIALETWERGRLNVYNFSHPMSEHLKELDELKKYIDYLNGGICHIEAKEVLDKKEYHSNKKT